MYLATLLRMPSTPCESEYAPLCAEKVARVTLILISTLTLKKESLNDLA